MFPGICDGAYRGHHQCNEAASNRPLRFYYRQPGSYLKTVYLSLLQVESLCQSFVEVQEEDSDPQDLPILFDKTVIDALIERCRSLGFQVSGESPLAYIGNVSRTTAAGRVRCVCETFSIRR